MILSRLRILLRNRRTSIRTKPHTSRFRHRAVLGLERLEDRAVPATFTVKNLDNAGVDSLRWAIDQANNHADQASTIVFQAGLTGEIVLTQVLDPLLKNITIAGPGDDALAVRRSTNFGVMNFRIFEIAQGTTCAISGLRLSNGRAFIGSGGAILNMSNLTVTSMTFNDNKADNTGGAIANIGILTVEDCSFYFNRADHNGGAIYNAQHATAEIRFGCNIFVNTAGFNGGGIYNAADATMLIDEADIYDNTASRHGGGIANFGDLSVDSAEIFNNVATNNGGGSTVMALRQSWIRASRPTPLRKVAECTSGLGPRHSRAASSKPTLHRCLVPAAAGSLAPL